MHGADDAPGTRTGLMAEPIIPDVVLCLMGSGIGPPVRSMAFTAVAMQRVQTKTAPQVIDLLSPEYDLLDLFHVLHPIGK